MAGDRSLVEQRRPEPAVPADASVWLADEGALQEMRRADNLVDVTGDVVLKGQVRRCSCNHIQSGHSTALPEGAINLSTKCTQLCTS